MFEAGLYLVGSYLIVLAVACWVSMVYGRRSRFAFEMTLGLTLLGLLGIMIVLAPTDPSFMCISILFSMVLAVASALAARALFNKKSERFRIRQALSVILLLALPLMPYALVESQTHLFGRGMVPPIQKGLQESGWFGDTEIVSLKVLYVTPKNALVYLVATVHARSRSDYYGSTLQLVRSEGGWTYQPNSEEIVWSDAGSAHGSVFPPYRGQGEW